MGIKKAFSVAYLALAAICVPIYYLAPKMLDNFNGGLEIYHETTTIARKNTVSSASYEPTNQIPERLSNHSSTSNLENIFSFE